VAEFACIAKDHNSCGSFPHSAEFPILECILICTRKSPFFFLATFRVECCDNLMAPIYSRTTKTTIPKITVRTLEWRVVMTEAPLPDVPGCPSATNFPDLMLNPVELKQLLSFTAGTWAKSSVKMISAHFCHLSASISSVWSFTKTRP